MVGCGKSIILQAATPSDIDLVIVALTQNNGFILFPDWFVLLITLRKENKIAAW